MSDTAVRVAVVGAGRWGLQHARVFASHPGAELRAVCGRTRERTDEPVEPAPLHAVGSDGASPPVDSLPIDGYDLLAARQVCDRLTSLTSDELEQVAHYEQTHRGRRTVLGKIEQLTT